MRLVNIWKDTFSGYDGIYSTERKVFISILHQLQGLSSTFRTVQANPLHNGLLEHRDFSEDQIQDSQLRQRIGILRDQSTEIIQEEVADIDKSPATNATIEEGLMMTIPI